MNLYRALYECRDERIRALTFAARPVDALPIAADWALSDDLLRIEELRELRPQLDLA